MTKTQMIGTLCKVKSNFLVSKVPSSCENVAGYETKKIIKKNTIIGMTKNV